MDGGGGNLQHISGGGSQCFHRAGVVAVLKGLQQVVAGAVAVVGNAQKIVGGNAVVLAALDNKIQTALSDAFFVMGQQCLGYAQVGRRLFLADAPLFS